MSLILRQYLGAVFVHTNLCGDCCGGPLAVAGKHHDSLQPKPAQSLNDSSSLRPQGIRYADDSGQFPVDCQIQMGKLLQKRVKAILLAVGNNAFFILKHKMRTANDHFFSGDCAGDAVRNQIFHLRMHFLMRQAALPRSLYNGVGHGMRKVFFQTGGKAEHLTFAVAAERYHLCNHRAGARQSTGFIKNNGVSLGDKLKIFTAFDSCVISACFTHGGKHRQRHSQL